MNVMAIPVVLCRGWTWHPYAAPVLASVTLLIWGFFYNKHIYIYIRLSQHPYYRKVLRRRPNYTKGLEAKRNKRTESMAM
jgi:hypothetical protein